MNTQIVILDFGSQYTQLIARKVRELGVYCEIIPGNESWSKIKDKDPKGIILSGGPFSVFEKDAPMIDSEVLSFNIPILGICYGMQIIAHTQGGKVQSVISHDEGEREFGKARLRDVVDCTLFNDIDFTGESSTVWMSHGDSVTALPSGYARLASTDDTSFAAAGDIHRDHYAIQFHPEVHHSARGKEILANFVFKIACAENDWDSLSFIDETVGSIKNQVESGNVVCGLSGGVDSTVAAALVSKAIGDRLHCIFVDNGLLRKDEAEDVMEQVKSLGLNIKLVDASDEFLSALAGVSDPEQKRKIIGRVFIDVFEREAREIKNVSHLVQGTLYPDVIESISVVGKAQTIKSHHNVGGLKENMELKLIEPLRELFKDEVRRIGHSLGIDKDLVNRQPFPGPGLAIRVLGEISSDRLFVLREADSILRQEIANFGLNETIWQSFVVLPGVKSVGVMGDGRTYEELAVIRAVTSTDGMTADWYHFDKEVLEKISSRIINEVSGINRVAYDISTKPPSTIEWE